MGSLIGKVYCLNAATGAKIWENTTGDLILSSPALSGTNVYIGSWDKKVYGFNAATGQWIYQALTADLVSSSPAKFDYMDTVKIYVGSDDGSLSCFNAAAGDSGPWPMFRNNPARTGTP